MKKLFVLASLLFATSLAAQHDDAKSIYQDPQQPIETRIAALIGSMTLEEKISQMKNSAPGIPHLDILPYNWWSEALHGIGRSGRATVFPQAIGMAATFDEQLIRRIATAISDEGRAKYNLAQEIGNYSMCAGLTFWSPNVNLFRDPRWGRGQETWGEDPILTGRMGVQFVMGMQGDDPDHLKTSACAKHYVVHSGPEAVRHSFNAIPSKRDFRETYLPAFKMLVEDANVESVMCAYNRTFGEACCGSPYLLQDILRDEFGFDGHVVSDCSALSNSHLHHGVASNAEESAALAIKSGVDLNCGWVYGAALKNAVEQGLISEEMIDKRITDLFRTRFKLGMFDPKGTSEYDKLDGSVINSPAHRALAREAAQKSVVMLKNNDVLPLNKNIRNLYLVGPMAADMQVLLGNYYGSSSQMSTLLEGITSHISAGTTMEYKQGVTVSSPNLNPIDWASGGGAGSDCVVLAMGINGLIEGEEGESILSAHKGDRETIELPDHQIEFIKKVKNSGAKKLLLVLFGGSPIALGETADLVDGILQVWYPGEEGGEAIADVIFGDVNPSGRLPISFPYSTEQLPPYDDYSMKGRTYRYMTEAPQFTFGFGLSYTKFAYGEPTISDDKIKRGEEITLSVPLTNVGELAGEEVAQLYIRCNAKNYDAPLCSLKDFKRISLQPNESQTLTFTVTPEMMETFDEEGNSQILKGTYTLWVGGASPSDRSAELGATTPAQIEFKVR